MKKRRLLVSIMAGFLACLMVLMLVLSALPVRAGAKSSSEIRQEIDEMIAQQEEIQAKQDELQTQIDQLQQGRTRLDSNFEDTTKEWESTEEPVLQSTRISSAVLKFGLIGLLVGIVLVCGAGTVQFLV